MVVADLSGPRRGRRGCPGPERTDVEPQLRAVLDSRDSHRPGPEPANRRHGRSTDKSPKVIQCEQTSVWATS